MQFYIASRLKNKKAVQCLSSKLKFAGWSHTYDWTLNIEEEKGSLDSDLLKSIGINELDGVKNADIVVILTPQGGGTHTELGMAIALNKEIYICHDDDTYFKCDENTSPFYWIPQVNRFVGNVDDIAKMLINQYRVK